MWVVRSTRQDVWENLAIEACLMREAPRAGVVLLLWVDRPCVVFGKNQNPWRECRVEGLARRRVPAARRVSGGGAVYHDEGNLNYSLLLPRDRYDTERGFAWVLDALHACGIPAVRLDRTSLGVGRRKVSGTAFALRGGGALHHGTLLVASDLQRLKEAMRRPDPEVEGRGIASVPAPVMNLSDAVPGLTAARVAEALVAALPRFFGDGRREVTATGDEALNPAAWRPEAARLRSMPWRFGETPPFHAAWPGPDARALRVAVRRDRLRRIDVGDLALVPSVFRGLAGLRFRPARLAARLRAAAAGECNAAHRSELRCAADRLADGWN